MTNRIVGQRQFYCVKFSPRRRPNPGGQTAHTGSHPEGAGSELGRQIPVDLQADADLNDGSGVVQVIRRLPLTFPR